MLWKLKMLSDFCQLLNCTQFCIPDICGVGHLFCPCNTAERQHLVCWHDCKVEKVLLLDFVRTVVFPYIGRWWKGKLEKEIENGAVAGLNHFALPPNFLKWKKLLQPLPCNSLKWKNSSNNHQHFIQLGNLRPFPASSPVDVGLGPKMH